MKEKNSMRSYKDRLVAIACPSKQHWTPSAHQINGGFQCFAFDLTWPLIGWILGVAPLQLVSSQKYAGQPLKADSVQATPHKMDSRERCKLGIIEAWCIADPKSKYAERIWKASESYSIRSIKAWKKKLLKTWTGKIHVLLEPGAPASATCENMSPAMK